MSYVVTRMCCLQYRDADLAYAHAFTVYLSVFCDIVIEHSLILSLQLNRCLLSKLYQVLNFGGFFFALIVHKAVKKVVFSSSKHLTPKLYRYMYLSNLGL